MKGIDTPGQAAFPKGMLGTRGTSLPPFRPKVPRITAGYLNEASESLPPRSRHSLGNGTNKLLPLLSLRLGMREMPVLKFLVVLRKEKRAGHNSLTVLTRSPNKTIICLRTTKENYCFASLYPDCKAFVRGLICPCCKTEGTFSRHGKYWKYYYRLIIGIFRIRCKVCKPAVPAQ